MSYRSSLTLLLIITSFSIVSAVERSDTLLHKLKEVTVTAHQPVKNFIPVQTLSGEELHRLNSNSVADALIYFSGVQVKIMVEWGA